MGIATFQVWLMATILDGAAGELFHHCRNSVVHQYSTTATLPTPF